MYNRPLLISRRLVSGINPGERACDMLVHAEVLFERAESVRRDVGFRGLADGYDRDDACLRRGGGRRRGS